MEPSPGRSDHADELLRQRGHAAHDHLRMFFALRVLSEPLPTRRRRAGQRAPVLLAVALAIAVGAVGATFGSHQVPSTPRAPARIVPSLPVATSAAPTPDATTSRVLNQAATNLIHAAAYHVIANAVACNSGAQGGVAFHFHIKVDADLTLLNTGDLVGTADIVGAAKPPSFAVTRVAGHLYLRGQALWNAVDPTSASKYGGRWVDVSSAAAPDAANAPLSTIVCELAGVPGIVTSFAQDLPHDFLVGETAYQGRPAIAVQEPHAAVGDPASLVVVGPPPIPAVLVGSQSLRSSTSGVTVQSLTVDHVGEPAVVSPPPGALVFG
jgi:hypothetical protein